MPCDKVMEQPLEERLDFSRTSFHSDNIAYEIRVNPKNNDVEYKFSPDSKWIPAD